MIGDTWSWIQTRLQNDTKVTPAVKSLINASQTTGNHDPAQLHTWVSPSTARSTQEARLFITHICVSGFRGIGPEVQLDLVPEPSLTIITGRNGSGKSSLAEAIELVTTGNVRRLEMRTAAWKENWRNVHAEGASIRVYLEPERRTSTAPHVELLARWAERAKLPDVHRSILIGGRATEGTESWDNDAHDHRPLLMYEDISELFKSGTAALHDAISQALGVEALTEAVRTLDQRSKEANSPAKWLATEKKSLLWELAELSDERAQTATELLGKRDVGVAALRRLAIGTATPSAAAQYLLDIEALRVTSEAECSAAAHRLRAASNAHSRSAPVAGQSLELRRAVLTAADALHTHLGDQPCPVCGVGTLGSSEAAAMRTAQQQMDEELSRQSGVQLRLLQALADARALTGAVPAVLGAEPPPALRVLARFCRQMWQTWAQAPDDPLELADHLESQGAAVRRALTDLQRAAAQQRTRRDDAWIPLATRLANYVDAYESWQTAKQSAKDAAEAHKWLRDAETDLKNERLTPIVATAAHIWSTLRQGSSVEIADVALKGATTARQLQVTSRVDGQTVGALGVMSQGELHALALALFLARATMPTSPFGFVVLDDPMQAMDSAKVAALAAVLAEIATSHQVVIFTHDDRLVAAAKQLGRDEALRVLEVERGPRSTVKVRELDLAAELWDSNE